MSNSGKTGITRYHRAQAVTLGLVLLALHFSAGAQTRGAIPIAFGQTVQGTLTSTDRLLEDGTPIDTYIFTVPAPGPYFIKASSPDIPLISSLIVSFQRDLPAYKMPLYLARVRRWVISV